MAKMRRGGDATSEIRYAPYDQDEWRRAKSGVEGEESKVIK